MSLPHHYPIYGYSHLLRTIENVLAKQAMFYHSNNLQGKVAALFRYLNFIDVNIFGFLNFIDVNNENVQCHVTVNDLIK